VPFDDVFSLPVTAKLDTATMALIARRDLSSPPPNPILNPDPNPNPSPNPNPNPSPSPSPSY
jgi:hypothetical protein